MLKLSCNHEMIIKPSDEHLRYGSLVGKFVFEGVRNLHGVRIYKYLGPTQNKS